MRIVYRSIAIACLSFAGFSGCVDGNAPSEKTSIETAPQTTVIRYSAEDIAALPLGEFVHFDLTRPNTVYALTYSNAADLDHVLVIRSDDKYVLGDQLSALDSAEGDQLKEVVISAADEGARSKSDQVVCNCPCCQLVDGQTVCC